MNYQIKDGCVVYTCGCHFKIVGPSTLPKGNFPAIKFETDLNRHDNDINLNCPATYKLLSTGFTKNIFQLETQLGRQFCKKLKPESIEHLSALGAILRPGVLKCKSADGTSMTEEYCLRKNKERDIEYYHPFLEKHLEKTYGVLIYQEQVIKIVMDLAAFTEQEADALRKGISKKLPEEIAKSRVKFLEGCKKTGKINEIEAEQIFTWIEKGARYLFNRSHSVSYGIIGYITAYIKTHFPLQHFTACLRYAQDGADTYEEIHEIVNDAKLFDIEVKPPNIDFLKNNFYTDGESVFFGLSDIKGVGESALTKLREILEKNNPQNWKDFLFDVLDELSSSVSRAIIEVGTLSKFGLDRQRMLAEFDIYHDHLTKKEKGWIIEYRQDFSDLVSGLKLGCKTKKEGGCCSNVNRVPKVESLIRLLENPPFPLEDTPNWIAAVEQEKLGIALSVSELDSYEIDRASHTCKDILKGWKRYAVLAVKIHRISPYKMKNGQEMCFLSVSDDSCALDNVVAFSSVWEEFKNHLAVDNLVFLSGNVNKKGSFQIEKVYPIS